MYTCFTTESCKTCIHTNIYIYTHTHTHYTHREKERETKRGWEVGGYTFWQEAQQHSNSADKPSNQKPAALVNRPALSGSALHAADGSSSSNFSLSFSQSRLNRQPLNRLTSYFVFSCQLKSLCLFFWVSLRSDFNNNFYFDI